MMYELEFLPVARQDMVALVQYIARELNNPAAAARLAGELMEAVERLAGFPYACPVYVPNRPLAEEYRKLTVRNYLVFYWVDEAGKKVTVARVIYGRRDYQELLK